MLKTRLKTYIYTQEAGTTLPQMQLVLVGLRNSSKTVQVTEQLDSVMRLDVVHPVAKHLQ